jgi:hypothetical protein
MTQLRPSNEPPVLLAVDERFIAHDDEVYQQALWSALGALDAACPAAVATLSADDLRLLADLGEQWAERRAARGEDASALAGAVRRIRHVLDRFERPEERACA